MRSGLRIAPQGRAIALWVLVAVGTIVPVAIAATSPLQASRDFMWIVGGMAGVIALALLLVQPLLASTFLPGLKSYEGRRWHRWIGFLVVFCVILHVGGLYLVSPDDIADALLLVAPTPFAIYGVVGLAGVLAIAVLVAMRSMLGMRYASWRIVHNLLAVVVVGASIVHAVLIDGAMGEVSKACLSALVVAATIFGLVRVHGTRARTKTIA